MFWANLHKNSYTGCFMVRQKCSHFVNERTFPIRLAKRISQVRFLRWSGKNNCSFDKTVPCSRPKHCSVYLINWVNGVCRGLCRSQSLSTFQELAAIIYRLDSSHRQFHRISRIGSLSSYVISADWDVSSQYIRGNSTVGHIYHCMSGAPFPYAIPGYKGSACCLGTAANGELVDHASIRDLEWASCNCRISYEAGCVAHSVEGNF